MYGNRVHAGDRVWRKRNADGFFSLMGPFTVYSINTVELVGADGQPVETKEYELEHGYSCTEDELVEDRWSQVQSAGGYMYSEAENMREKAEQEALAAQEAALEPAADPDPFADAVAPAPPGA